MGYRKITPAQRRRVHRLHADGVSFRQIAERVGISLSSVNAIIQGQRSSDNHHVAEEADEAVNPGPIPYERLCDRAKRGLEDFDYFRRVYLGHLPTPWQSEMCREVIAALSSAQREFVVENVAPGLGKSTAIHDIAAWLTCRDRTIRGLFGSRLQSNADRALARLRRTLERQTPVKARQQDIDDGLACDAEATLSADFGRFKPVTAAELWRADGFVVLQQDDVPIEEKEPNWSSYGMDAGVLGNRFNVIFWDDVVDKKTLRTLDAVEAQRTWWDDEAETRLEPRGALFLVGQRLAAHDLYRYCLDKRVPFTEEEHAEIALLDPEAQEERTRTQPAMYRHIVYRAHDDERCTEDHGIHAKPWPEGCLLDPKRLPWRDLYNIKHTKQQSFLVSYQQEDVDESNVLVKRVWVTGGIDPEARTQHVGCLDPNRSLWQVPDVAGRRIMVAGVDPSGENWWGIQCWCWTPDADDQLWLMDLLRVKMGGNDLLDWDHEAQRFTGVMQTWQEKSRQLGAPISRWIIEKNAAQRYLLQFNHVHRWLRQHPETLIVPHETNQNKVDPDFGVSMVRNWWSSGRIRLPDSKPEAHFASLRLTTEAQRYPQSATTDQVMTHWFVIRHLPTLDTRVDTDGRQERPRVASMIPDRRLVAV